MLLFTSMSSTNYGLASVLYEVILTMGSTVVKERFGPVSIPWKEGWGGVGWGGVGTDLSGLDLKSGPSVMALWGWP